MERTTQRAHLVIVPRIFYQLNVTLTCISLLMSRFQRYLEVKAGRKTAACYQNTVKVIFSLFLWTVLNVELNHLYFWVPELRLHHPAIYCGNRLR